ncbi:MAG TPA: hypothetical protein VFU15_17215, partial [Bacteroidia bacterium]|nr:hypothetical protein [Bacteroidia bacterium]
MNNSFSDFMKRHAIKFVAVLVFAVVTVAFFSPVFFDGKRVRQGDVTNFQGTAKEIMDYRAKTGKEPLWTNSMFGGMPAYQISTLYPNNLVQYVQDFFMKVIPSPATAIFLCMVGFYFLLITLKVDPLAAMAGAFAFGFSTYFVIIIQAGHNTQAFAVAYMAPVLMGVFLTMRGKLFLGSALTALALALEINANHLQITYYLMLTVLLLGIGEAVRLYREGEVKYLVRAAGLLAVAAFVAVLPNITNLYLTNEYGKESTRGQSDITVDNTQQKKTSGLPIEYATQWSYGKGETMTLMIPNFYGGASEAIQNYDKDALDDVDQNFRENIGSNSAYFGDQPFTSGPVYVGAIICFLFVLGLFIVKDSIKWWLLGATALSILLAWGKNFIGFTEFFFNYFPGYNKFRAVSMTLVIAELTMPILAMLTIREIMRDPGIIKAKMKKVLLALGLTGGLSLLVWLAPSMFVTTVTDEETAQITQGIKGQGGSDAVIGQYIDELSNARTSIVKGDAIRSFAFIALSFGLIYFYSRQKLSGNVFAIAMAGLVVLDMFLVAHRYLNSSNYEKARKNETPYVMSKADEMIISDQAQNHDLGSRVLNVAVQTWQDGSTSYFHKSIGGYHGAKLKRMQELYEQVMENNVNQVRAAIQQGQNDSMLRIVLSQQPALNMMNAKYIIYNPDGGV